MPSGPCRQSVVLVGTAGDDRARAQNLTRAIPRIPCTRRSCVDTASVPVTFNAHAETRLITGEDAMRIEVSETTGRLAIVAMQPFRASHRVLTFDLRIDLPEPDASRAKSGAAVPSGRYRGALIGFALRRVVRILRRRRPKRAGPTPVFASEWQDAGPRCRLPIRLRSRAT